MEMGGRGAVGSMGDGGGGRGGHRHGVQENPTSPELETERSRHPPPGIPSDRNKFQLHISPLLPYTGWDRNHPSLPYTHFSMKHLLRATRLGR